MDVARYCWIPFFCCDAPGGGSVATTPRFRTFREYGWEFRRHCGPHFCRHCAQRTVTCDAPGGGSIATKTSDPRVFCDAPSRGLDPSTATSGALGGASPGACGAIWGSRRSLARSLWSLFLNIWAWNHWKTLCFSAFEPEIIQKDCKNSVFWNFSWNR